MTLVSMIVFFKNQSVVSMKFYQMLQICIFNYYYTHLFHMMDDMAWQ